MWTTVCLEWAAPDPLCAEQCEGLCPRTLPVSISLCVGSTLSNHPKLGSTLSGSAVTPRPNPRPVSDLIDPCTDPTAPDSNVTRIVESLVTCPNSVSHVPENLSCFYYRKSWGQDKQRPGPVYSLWTGLQTIINIVLMVQRRWLNQYI